MRKSHIVLCSISVAASLMMFQNCTQVKYNYTSLEESSALKKEIFDAQSVVGDVVSSGGAIPSENLRVRSVDQAMENMVQACDKSAYETEKEEALALAAQNPKLIPVQYAISFGVKSDDLAHVAHNRAILSEKRGVFGDKYIVPFSSYTVWPQDKGGNGYPGYYAQGYYQTDYKKAKSDYILGKKCFFNVVEITGQGKMNGSYMDFLNSQNVGNVHGAHYLLTGQVVASGETQFTLFDKVENLREPQIISLFVADFRAQHFTSKYADKIMKDLDVQRGRTAFLNTKDIFDMTVLFQGYHEHIWNLSHDFIGENGKVFSSMVGVPQLAMNLMSGAIESTTLVPSQYTPIVLDLGDDGVRTTDTAWGSYFDMAAKGEGPHRTAWLGGSFHNLIEIQATTALKTNKRKIASVQRDPVLAQDGVSEKVKMDIRRIADDGFLVIPDAQGQVSSSKNLFGDNLEVNGKKYENGFLALQALANKDCQSESYKDRYFGPWDKELYNTKIKVWIDANRNGVSESGELLSLKDAGVVALNACHIVSQQETDSFGNGTALRSAFLYSSPAQITKLLADEEEILFQLEEGKSKKGFAVKFRLAVDLIFQTYPDQILPRLEQLSMASK